MICVAPTHIERWVILFSGFRQDASEMTGSVLAYANVRAQCVGPQSVVELRTWDTPVRPLAHQIRNLSVERPDIVLGGYSFGGQTAVNLAKQLKLCGLGVRKMVLADPVYRHGYYAGWWRSLMPFVEIEVPTNVHEVIYFVQRNPVVSIGREGGWIQPAGHNVVPVSKQTTKIWPPKILSQDHSNMDDSREYHQALLEACNG